MTQLHNLRLKAFLQGLSGADFRVFGAERLVFPPSGAISGTFGAECLVLLLSGAIFGDFGAAGLPRLRGGGSGSAEG